MEKEKPISGTLVIPVSDELALRVHIGEDGIVYCLKDVCEILKKSYKKSRRTLDSSKLSWHRTPTEGGLQWMTFLSQEALFDFIDGIPFGKVKGFIDLLADAVFPAVNILLDEADCDDGETLDEATFHKFDESTGKSTNQSTEETTHKTTDKTTDETTEVTQIGSNRQIVLVINLI